jgi:hypothetical protein
LRANQRWVGWEEEGGVGAIMHYISFAAYLPYQILGDKQK